MLLGALGTEATEIILYRSGDLYVVGWRTTGSPDGCDEARTDGILHAVELIKQTIFANTQLNLEKKRKGQSLTKFDEKFLLYKSEKLI